MRFGNLSRYETIECLKLAQQELNNDWSLVESLEPQLLQYFSLDK